VEHRLKERLSPRDADDSPSATAGSGGGGEEGVAGAHGARRARWESVDARGTLGETLTTLERGLMIWHSCG